MHHRNKQLPTALGNTFKTARTLAVTLCLSALSVNAMSATTQLDKVTDSKKITVAAVSGNSTFFKTQGFMHGFGYDLARAYAVDLDAKLNIKTYKSQAAALKAVKNGKADFALTTANSKAISDMGLSAQSLSCGHNSILSKNGLDTQVNWSFKDAQDPIVAHANEFLCQPTQVRTTKKLASFYNQNLMRDRYAKHHFDKTMRKRLPAYKASFKQHANTHKLDWQLLVAMGYQESHLKANAVSPTGVRGLMMLTNRTAKAMGVSNRVDPGQSIRGGAKYLKLMKNEFKNVPDPDRLWFSLASYNMGPNAVKRIQKKVKAQGKDPHRWANVYQYMSDNARSNSRYTQCMHYVTRIRTYLETLKTTAA